MFPLITEHRGIEIRYGYYMRADGWRANFFLPEERRKVPGFQRVVTIDLPAAIAPGKNYAGGDSEEEALTQARSMIDSYLGDE